MTSTQPHFQSRTQAFWIVLGALLAFGAWSAISSRLPQAEVAESNFQANLIRLERWKLDPAPENVIVGSSIGARLLPRYFHGTALDGMHNLCLDGSGPSLGLKLVLESPNRPRRVFIEVHRLGKPWHPNDDAVLAAAHGPGMRLAGVAAGFRAASRPTTRLFAWMKSRQDPAGAPAEPGKLVSEAAVELHRATPSWERDLANDLEALRRRGIDAVLVRFPVGRENPPDAEVESGADRLARSLGVPLVDLYRESVRRKLPITYTDNLHLTPRSAAAISGLLAVAATEVGKSKDESRRSGGTDSGFA